jgi:hypothetical protein
MSRPLSPVAALLVSAFFTLAVTSGCAPAIRPEPVSTAVSADGGRPAHVERLYFGRNMAGTAVEFVHLVGPEAEDRVQAVIDEYKRRFAQQAVMRVVTEARASF